MTARREAVGGTLVIGGGFAGAYVARLLGKRGATIVNPDNFMLYTPLLPEAAAGTLEPRHVVVPLRQMCPHAELLLGRVVSRDASAKSVIAETLGGTFEIGYERLVVALGAVPRTFPVPGLAGVRPRVQGRRRRDRAAQPSPAVARVGCRPPRPGRGGARPRLRLRGRRVRGSRGARRARGPRARRRATLLSDAAAGPAALGARGRRTADPRRHSPEAGRVHAPLPRAARDRDPRRDDAHVVRRARGGVVRRDEDPREDARLGRRRAGEPGPGAARAPARRARAGRSSSRRCR